MNKINLRDLYPNTYKTDTYARKFYEDAYKAAVQIVGGEQYVICAVMHADERNRAIPHSMALLLV